MIAKIVTATLILGSVLGMSGPVRAEEERLWRVQAIDTMKYSRDTARQENIVTKIPNWVDMVASLGPSHIAIGTPYDEEFNKVLKTWIQESRKHGLKIWFRGNFSGWEGWFDYPEITDPNEHHNNLTKFIISNPDLFENGDIFTPAPEPENGIIGDPRMSTENRIRFLAFLKQSYLTCTKAFWSISKLVECGYFSTNGDVARDILDQDTVNKIGKTVTMDHYVTDPKRFGRDIEVISSKFGVPVILGEFGAPIPDLHGDLDEDQQAAIVREFMIELDDKKSKVGGINYWGFLGGSTALFNPDNSPRKVVEVIRDYYQPGVIKGTIRSVTGKRLAGVRVSINKGKEVTATDHAGNYSITLPVAEYSIDVRDSYYKPVTIYQSVGRNAEITRDIDLMPRTALSWWQKLWLDIKEKFEIF